MWKKTTFLSNPHVVLNLQHCNGFVRTVYIIMIWNNKKWLAYWNCWNVTHLYVIFHSISLKDFLSFECSFLPFVQFSSVLFFRSSNPYALYIVCMIFYIDDYWEEDCYSPSVMAREVSTLSPCWTCTLETSTWHICKVSAPFSFSSHFQFQLHIVSDSHYVTQAVSF